MEGKYDERVCICALNRIFGFKPRIALALIGHKGSASSVFSMDREELESVIGPYSGFRDSINGKAIETAEKELEFLNKKNYGFIGINDKRYPSLLKECDDPPLGLYTRSSSDLETVFDARPAIAIVGTRDISPYGKEWCRRLVATLARTERKPLIVSGLALGTDITAQYQALESGLPTLSVMATGIESTYPRQNEAAAERIASTPGCALITDYPTGTVPLAINFLRRNRIIAGMSLATILIESKAKGGGMMTARLAFSYNRDVYALPGRIDDQRSQGCNQLIREKIAEPITDLDDLVDRLGLKSDRSERQENVVKDMEIFYKGKVPDDELADMVLVLKTIRNSKGINLEEICSLIGKPYGKVAECTGIMESDGIISVDLLQRCTINLKNM